MKKDTSVTVRVDSEIKAQAEQILSSYGLNMSTAIDMLLHQIVRQKAVPLSLSIGEPDPVLAGVERARAQRDAGNSGTPAREVLNQMRSTIREVNDARQKI